MGETTSELESKGLWVPPHPVSPDLMTYSLKAGTLEGRNGGPVLR